MNRIAAVLTALFLSAHVATAQVPPATLRAEMFSQAAAQNTDLLATPLSLFGPAGERRVTTFEVSISLVTTGSVVNLMTTQGATTITGALNGGTAVTAGVETTLTFRASSSCTYNLQLATATTVGRLIVSEVRSSISVAGGPGVGGGQVSAILDAKGITSGGVYTAPADDQTLAEVLASGNVSGANNLTMSASQLLRHLAATGVDGVAWRVPSSVAQIELRTLANTEFAGLGAKELYVAADADWTTSSVAIVRDDAVSNPAVRLASDGQFGWSSTTNADVAADTGMKRDAAGRVAFTDGSSGDGSCRADAVIVGAASTSGARLEVNAGVLTAREGDDSADAPFRALTVVVGDGTTSLPSVAGADADTGASFAANTISLSTGGSERLRINSSGNFVLNAGILSQYRAEVSDSSTGTVSGSAYALTYTNIGASGTITFALPSSPLSGRILTFVRNAAFAVRVDPGASEKILDPALTGLADGEYAEATANNSYVTVMALSTGDWQVIAKGGTWVEETP